MIKITDINSSGNGVGKDEGMAVFLPYTIVGEQAEWQEISREKKFVIGKATDITTPSPHRITPECPHFGSCGGCNLMHMDYNEQLRCKENIVHSALLRIGKSEADISPILPAPSCTAYRNKASFPVRLGKIGYYQEGTHNIVDIKSCPLLKDEINQVLSCLRPFVAKYQHIGHVVVRSTCGQLSITIVTDTLPFPYGKELIECLAPVNPASIYLNLNSNPKIILGKKTVLLTGNPTTEYKITGNRFAVSPTAFLQVNDPQAEKLYSLALSAMDFNGKTVIDAYCGIGTLTLALAKHAKSVIGIEVNSASISDAKAASKAAGITNAEFYSGRCEDLLPNLVSKCQTPPILTVDPPRAGIDGKLIEAICNSSIQEIIYISCNPSTLARDINRLSQGGFEPRSVTPVDMFPHTAHVECVAVITRKNPANTVNV